MEKEAQGRGTSFCKSMRQSSVQTKHWCVDTRKISAVDNTLKIVNTIESGSDIITIRDRTTLPCECQTLTEQAAANRDTVLVIMAVFITFSKSSRVIKCSMFSCSHHVSSPLLQQ